MKRGRHNIRRTIQEKITETLTILNTPATTSVLMKEISKSLNRKISWNTIQKYVQELVESGQVQTIQLAHSKLENKSGLVMYTLKK